MKMIRLKDSPNQTIRLIVTATSLAAVLSLTPRLILIPSSAFAQNTTMTAVTGQQGLNQHRTPRGSAAIANRPLGHKSHRLTRKPLASGHDSITMSIPSASLPIQNSLISTLPDETTTTGQTTQASPSVTPVSQSVLGNLSPGSPASPTPINSAGTTSLSKTSLTGAGLTAAASSGTALSSSTAGSRALGRLLSEMPGMSRLITVPSTSPPTVTPTITVSPGSVSFAATQGAANPTGKSLTISNVGGTLNWAASENVSWLSITPGSGSGSGTLTATVNTAGLATGTYNGTITVTATGATTRTVGVTLTVNPPSTSSATLSWDPNTEPDLASYRVYRSTTPGVYGAAIATVPAGTVNYVVTGLQTGNTYYFTVTAVDQANNESLRSNEVSKSIF